MIYLIYFVIGLLAGVVAGLLGTGGCALIMPVISKTTATWLIWLSVLLLLSFPCGCFTKDCLSKPKRLKPVPQIPGKPLSKRILGSFIGTLTGIIGLGGGYAVVNIPVAIVLWIGALIGAIYSAKLVAKFKLNLLKALVGFLFLYVSLKYILIYFGIHIWRKKLLLSQYWRM